MHVTLKQPGLWLAHCKHCGESGHLMARTPKDKDIGSVYKEVITRFDYNEINNLDSICIDDVSFDYATYRTYSDTVGPKSLRKFAGTLSNPMPPEIRYGISTCMSALGIKWDERKIVIPVGTEGHYAHNGILVRWDYPEYKGPKYLNNSMGPNCYIAPGYGNVYSGNTKSSLVLVEDAISASVLSTNYGVRTMWLGGTSIHPEQIQSIAHADEEIEKILVWLDDDNEQVEANSRKIKDELKSIFPEVFVTSSVFTDRRTTSLPKSPKDVYLGDWGWGEEYDVKESDRTRLPIFEQFLKL